MGFEIGGADGTEDHGSAKERDPTMGPFPGKAAVDFAD
jgi:hypothetical protein